MKSEELCISKGAKKEKALALEGKSCQPERLSPVSLSVFRLVLDLLFDCSRVLEYAKTRTVTV